MGEIFKAICAYRILPRNDLGLNPEGKLLTGFGSESFSRPNPEGKLPTEFRPKCSQVKFYMRIAYNM